MAANPPDVPAATEAESLAQLAAQIGDLTALLKRENDGRLSPAEIACAAVGNACMTVAMTGIACLPVLIFIRMNVGA